MTGPDTRTIANGLMSRLVIVFAIAILLLGNLLGIIGIVKASDASLSPPHSDIGLDTDLPPDGLYNILLVNITVDVNVGGVFYLSGELRDAGGGILIESQSSVAALTTGLQTVKLRFTGYVIRSSRIVGPYQVGISLFDDTFKLLDTGFHLTNFYLPSEFQNLPAHLSPPHSDYTIDRDADMLDDFLIISTSIQANETATYLVEVTLLDNSGTIVITSGSNETLLPTGNRRVDVSLIGYAIRLSGFDGPYQVELRLYDDSSNLLDQGSHLTSPYLSANFEPSPAAFLSPHSDRGIDLNGNTLFEYLVVTAYLAVFSNGTYLITGMSPFGVIENKTYLETGIQPVDLHFMGSHIENSGIDGPYVIDLELRDEFNNILDIDTHTTAGYLAKDFEPDPPAAFNPPHRDYGLDTDSDMKFNYLVVEANLSIDAAGFYKVKAELYDSISMKQITETSNWTWLAQGQNIIPLLFDGITIRLSRMDGPYGVYLRLFDGIGYYLDFNILSTKPYAYTDFDMPPAAFTPPHDDYGLDTDFPPDGLFNFLVVNASIRVKDSGWYLLYGSLMDGNLDPITQAQSSSNLVTGPEWMELQFSAFNISKSGVDGPYVVLMDLYYFEGQEPVRVDWNLYFTHSYNSTDFMAPPSATIWGYVYNSTNNSPVEGAEVSVLNYTYGWIDHTMTNETGYYEIEVFDGDFCILMDADTLQSNVSLISVAGSVEATRYLEPSIPNEMYINLTFLDWNSLSYDSITAALTDNRSIRFMVDVMVGDRNGFVDQNELDLFATFLAGSEEIIPSNTTDHLRVDDTYYDLDAGSQIIAIDALGPIVSTNPIFLYVSANFTSNNTIPPSNIHWIGWNVTYDDEKDLSVYSGQLPSGFTLWGFDPVLNISIVGVGMRNVTIDPGADWNLSDDIDYVWLNLTVGQGPPDAEAPKIANTSINGSPSPTYGLLDPPSVLYLNATIDDSSSGNLPIGGANFTLGPKNWSSSTPISPADGLFDSPLEDVSVTIPAPSTTTTYCVYGWDSLLNSNTTGSCITLTILDNLGPQILNLQINPSTFFLSLAPPSTTLTATIDDTLSGSSVILGANYTTPMSDSWPGTPMVAVDGFFDSPIEEVAANLPLPASAGVFNYYVHAWDSNPAYNVSSSVQITIIDDLGPYISGLRLNGQSSATVQTGTPVLVDAIVDDTGGRGDTSIQGANYTINGDWGTSTTMFASDGSYDAPTEAVIVTIDTTGWSDGTYQVCVYGWDSSLNYNTTGACASLTLYSVDDQPPEISDVLLDGSASATILPGTQVNLTARIHDEGSVQSNIAFANYSVDMVWAEINMLPLDGLLNSADEYVYLLIDTTGWEERSYQICVHGADVVPNYNTSFGACADLVIQMPPDTIGPIIQNISADPYEQNVGEYVRLSANVYDDYGVSLVSISIVDPSGDILGNYTMNYDTLSREYYYVRSFSEPGSYAYTIWAGDTNGNWNSATGSFEVVGASLAPSIIEEFWWVFVILIIAILLALLLAWKTRFSKISGESDSGKPGRVPKGPKDDEGGKHVHTFESGKSIEHESVVKCQTCGDAVLLLGDTNLLKARCSHCGSTLLEAVKGFNYLIVDDEPTVAYQGFKSILEKDIPGLCISTTFPEKLIKRYDVQGVELYWLTDTATETEVKTLDPKRLDFEIMRAISTFLKDHPEGAVMIDGVENLIVENGFDSVFRFIKKINDIASVGGATIFVPLAPSSLGDDELATFQKEFDRVQVLTSLGKGVGRS